MCGAARRIDRQGRLGFHQYRLDAPSAAPNVDVAAEHRRDAEYLMHRGVAAGFTGRAFSAAHDDIWYPSADELLAAGVATEITGDVNRRAADRLAA